MQKPSGYDEAQTSGGFTPVELGGHYCVVKQVTEMKSSTNKDMIVVLFDFCKPDKQDGYFSNSFNNDSRSDKKWPFNGSKYIMVYSYNDPQRTSRQFKTFCTCIEKSNNYTIQWGANNWASQFKGKKIGCVYGEEEHEYEGKISMRRVPKWFCNTDAVKDAQIPAVRYLPSAMPKPETTTSADTAFMDIAPGVEEEIPF